MSEAMGGTGGKGRVLYCFIQTDNRANGGVISLLKIATSLKTFTPVFVTQTRTPRTEELSRCGFLVIHLESFNWNNPLLRPLAVLLWNLRIVDIIRRHQISVVHANDNQMVWRTIFASKLLGCRFVANIRGVFEPHMKYGLNRLWVNFCDHIIVLSKEMELELLKRLPFFNRGHAGRRLNVIRSILSDEFFTRSIVLPSTDRDEFVGHVLIAAVFNPLKNQLAFLEKAAPLLKEKNICMHFVGDFDPQRDRYSRKCIRVVTELGLDSHVVFHGFTNEIQAHYLHSDLTLVVSTREGLARCMIESLACGTPVVSFDVCSAEEVLSSNDCGIVVKQGDYERLCFEINSLLKDRAKLQRMSSNGIVAAKRMFSTDQIIGQYEGVYATPA